MTEKERSSLNAPSLKTSKEILFWRKVLKLAIDLGEKDAEEMIEKILDKLIERE